MADVEFVGEKTERRPVEALIPYARNARTHSPEQVGQIAASMREFGFTYPVLVDEEDGIIAGHGRVMAAQKLKLVEVPVIVARGWSDEKKRAYILADNKIALNAGWDDALLRVELGELQGLGFDLSLTGFSSLELRGLFSTEEGNTDPDDVPDVPVLPVSQPGDLWRLGDHMLICGDSTDPSTVERVLGGARPHLCVTDPPYGTNYRSARRGTEFLVDGADRAHGDVRNDTRADWREAWALFSGDVLYVWHNPLEAMTVHQGLEAQGFELRAQVIWRKNSIVIGPPKGHYHWRHEACFYSVRKGKTGHWSGTRKEDTVWDVDRPKKSETGHSTQKPVELFRRPMENNSSPGEHVYDPFAGSGTSTIAAQMTKRICHSVEIDPAHVDRAVLRFAAFAGVAPILAETGETFEQVRARRGVVEPTEAVV